MSSVLIRDVPAEDLQHIRAAASAQGVSLQSYLRDALLAQARFVRRQEALTRTAQRLEGLEGVPEGERQAVLEEIAAAHVERSNKLGEHAQP